MNYIGAALFFFLPFYIADSLMAYISYLLAGRRIPYRKVFVLQIPAALIQSIVYSPLLLIRYDDFSSMRDYYLWASLCSVTNTVITVSWVYFLFRDTDKKKNFFYISAVFPFIVIGDYCVEAIRYVVSPETTYGSLRDTVWSLGAISMYFVSCFLVYACIATIIRLASKTDFWSKLQAFESYPKMYIPIGIVFFLFDTFWNVFGTELIPDFWFRPRIAILYLTFLALVVFQANNIKRTASLDATQNLLLQQQNYINKLESIQREIRSIQHDYKNILSGLYAQASEGNAKAVKEYIDTKLLKVDEAVREDLSQMNQLTRIEISELKGLILTKMLEAERDKVSLRLEVMFPVSKTSMATEDLLGCVGILLDNAIEEARKKESAAVTLLLLQEDKSLTIVVKNPVQGKPDFSQIQNEGYSSRGSDRGISLSNYQNIVRKYPNSTQETKIEGEHFIQVLVLAGD